MRTKFDANHIPPIPIGTVVVRNPTSGSRSEPIRMLLDTGSDVTILPARQVASLHLNPSATPEIELAGFDGTTRTIPAVYAQVVFLGKRLTGEYYLLNEDLGIIGRDIMNEFVILFDGPNLEWVSNPRPVTHRS